MLELSKRVIKDCLTVKNGEDYDLGRVGIALCMLGLIGLSAYGVYLEHKFDAQGFGVGAGTILGAGGFGLSMKSKTEPD